MKNFNKVYIKLLEDMTSGAVFGPGQAHAPVQGQSSDFYAPGDARNIWGGAPKPLKRKKHLTKKKKLKKRKFPLIRRTFPGGM
jgi:hypothetical protein